jgi:hypothetical protein
LQKTAYVWGFPYFALSKVTMMQMMISLQALRRGECFVNIAKLQKQLQIDSALVSQRDTTTNRKKTKAPRHKASCNCAHSYIRPLQFSQIVSKTRLDPMAGHFFKYNPKKKTITDQLVNINHADLSDCNRSQDVAVTDIDNGDRRKRLKSTHEIYNGEVSEFSHYARLNEIIRFDQINPKIEMDVEKLVQNKLNVAIDDMSFTLDRNELRYNQSCFREPICMLAKSMLGFVETVNATMF